ncbi:hypothetical protein [Liquorilactobacillus vini]|uniref:hypothetical protein n=1 Tax=Liquorilactobacillus vini TaxID=238015 RepID=UPI0002DB0631|nr:hypothetical protein [Liquorilactobacillus vini]
MRINLKNPATNQFKQCKIGFSWTVFFFGFFPALFRGDWKWTVIILLIDLLTGAWSYGILSGVTNIVFAFVYNKLYVNDLLTAGYQPADSASKDALLAKGFTVQG